MLSLTHVTFFQNNPHGPIEITCCQYVTLCLRCVKGHKTSYSCCFFFFYSIIFFYFTTMLFNNSATASVKKCNLNTILD